MKKRGIALLLAASVFALGTLTGCGSSGTENDGSAQESAPAAEEVSGEEAAENESASGTVEKIKVGYALKTVQEERWQRELDGCVATAEELGIEFVYQVANGDAQTQVSQVENMITQGCDVIMVTAVDSGSLSNVLQEAHEDGIKVVTYDQPLDNSYSDAFVGYDDFTNGSLIASALKDKNVSGKIVLLHGDKTSNIEQIVAGEKFVLDALDVEIVGEQYCINWGAEAALAHAQNALADNNNDIAAFVCMNDGIASGTIQALEEAGIAGKVFVTGMDCELTAVQRIAAGTQTSTLYKDSAALSRAAVETAYALAKGEAIETDKTINLGVNDMPHVVVHSAVITADNIQTEIIDKGVYTEEEVYKE